MRLDELNKVNMSFLDRVLFMITADNEIMARLLRNERHKYYRLGRKIQIKHVADSVLRATVELNKYSKNIKLQEDNPIDLIVGINFKIDDYMMEGR